LTLSQLLKNTEHSFIKEGDCQINHLTIDSRDMQPNTLFVCASAFNVDRHSFIEQAANEGAVAFIVEKDVEVPTGTIAVKVKNSRIALATIAANFYNNPNIPTVGVTGTNGKTSVTFYVQSILMEHGKKAGLIGTVGTKINNEPINIKFATSTTPDTIELMQIIAHMKKNHVDYNVMEVTSHALALHKVDSLKFLVGVFTNLTQDHLDLHGTMENYRDAKAKLFTLSQNSLINIDDPYGSYMASVATGSVITYSIEKQSHIQAKNITYTPKGSAFDVVMFGESHSFKLPIAGRFSVYNALGAIGASHVIGVPMSVIQSALANLKTVPGRIEKVENTKGLNVIVDYSHTPNSLQIIIQTAKEFTAGNVITVFGCGGDRDAEKRPIMGAIAAKYSDFSIITSDNPRTEDPNKILTDIEAGMVGASYAKEVDRYEAIKQAINMASKEDTIIIAGKGHEAYQIFKDKTITFDDVQIAREIMGEIGYNGTN